MVTLYKPRSTWIATITCLDNDGYAQHVQRQDRSMKRALRLARNQFRKQFGRRPR